MRNGQVKQAAQRAIDALKRDERHPHSRFVRMDFAHYGQYACRACLEMIVTNTVKITANYDTSKSHDLPVHGVFGGVAPQGHVAASLYAERWVLPKKTEIEVLVQDGSNKVVSSTETPIDTKEGVMRTVLATYYMDAATAESIGNWLIQKAADARSALGA